MPKVLVVDDELDYRDELEFALSQEHFDVATAASGREAVQVGTRYRPDVLVADWMLRNHIHGLQVAEVVRAVNPDVRTILMTGFASRDLRWAAREADVFEFIEKPFDTERILDSVRRAVESSSSPREPSAVGVLEVDKHGSVVYANDRARQLFSATEAGPDVARLDELFAPRMLTFVETATEQWVDIFPRCGQPISWHIRAAEYADTGGRLLVLLATEDLALKDQPLVRMLLGMSSTKEAVWPLEGTALIVDGHQLVRRVLAESLQRLGCVCHAAETYAQALQVFDRARDVSVVVLDYDLPHGSPALTTKRLLAADPDVRIVGSSHLDRAGEFELLGVRRFLCKPWTARDLIEVLKADV